MVTAILDGPAANLDAEVAAHQFFESFDVLSRTQEIELVLLRAHGALDSPYRIRRPEIPKLTMGEQQFLAYLSKPLPQSRRLSGHIVGAADHGQAGELRGPLGEKTKQ